MNYREKFVESSMFEYARNRYAQFNGASAFRALCQMQHYRIPTRLLDWTESLGTALFFAVGDGSADLDAWLFALNARKLNRITSMEQDWRNIHEESSWGTRFRCEFIMCDTPERWYSSVDHIAKKDDCKWELIKRLKDERTTFRGTSVPVKCLSLHCTPVAVLPGATERAVQQRSLFTLHGGWLGDTNGTHPRDLIELNKAQEPENAFLRAWKIPGAAKAQIKRELHAFGFHAATIFPDSPDILGAAIAEMF